MFAVVLRIDNIKIYSQSVFKSKSCDFLRDRSVVLPKNGDGLSAGRPDSTVNGAR